VIDADGRDLVFVTGAPGSKWSALAHALAYGDGVDNSDVAETRTYAGGRTSHFGNYFGPGMEFGDNFDRLDQLTREELQHAFAQPYASASAGGVKLLKSHMFAAHLPVLLEMFPAARAVVVHRSDRACLRWWLEAGGFGISFPDYAWYGDVDGMAAQIARDNAAIVEFVARAGLRLRRHRSMAPVLAQLGMRYSREGVMAYAGTAWERRYGLGDATTYEEIMAALHARARLAEVACYTPILR
jgi:hypothetical protein